MIHGLTRRSAAGLASILAGLLVATSGIGFGADQELVGTWEFTVTADGEQLPGFLTLEWAGEDLAGSVKTYAGALDLQAITWSDEMLGFELTAPEWSPDPVRVELHRHGRVMEGTATSSAGTHRAWAMKELVAADPAKLERFMAMTGLRTAEEVALAVTNYSSNLHDIHQLAGGNPFDNTNTVYSGSGDDAALNREIPRYAADAGAEGYMRAWYTPTGRISDPVLSVHALRDSLVPIETRQWFDDATRIQGTNDLFVQMWVDQDWARYDRKVVDQAVAMLDRWVREGVRPTPGELKPGYRSPR